MVTDSFWLKCFILPISKLLPSSTVFVGSKFDIGGVHDRGEGRGIQTFFLSQIIITRMPFYPGLPFFSSQNLKSHKKYVCYKNSHMSRITLQLSKKTVPGWRFARYNDLARAYLTWLPGC